ncbi:hypothetical protein [Natronomonas marina]|jgi:hypothetical protein|uniref:hypothetical protein n=1 Tax=Natronomonas marina TaxID=2961939 RepID=UPI0020C9DF34|nr:hypothetical protein [Natronomonas marina]
MDTSVTMRPVDAVSADSRVRHVDELDWPAKSHLSQFEPDEPVDVDESVADTFRRCDVVKFTEYYEVTVD